MLSLVDLKDFAEICRAIEDFTASRARLDGAIGSHCTTRSPAPDDLRVAGSGAPSHRFYGNARTSK